MCGLGEPGGDEVPEDGVLVVGLTGDFGGDTEELFGAGDASSGGEGFPDTVPESGIGRSGGGACGGFILFVVELEAHGNGEVVIQSVGQSLSVD